MCEHAPCFCLYDNISVKGSVKTLTESSKPHFTLLNRKAFVYITPLVWFIIEEVLVFI